VHLLAHRRANRVEALGLIEGDDRHRAAGLIENGFIGHGWSSQWLFVEIYGAISGLVAVKSLRQLAASEIGYRWVRGA